VVIGPVVMVIGLGLAQVAVNMATGKAGDQQVVPYGTALSVAAISLLATMLTAIRARRLLKLVPILVGVAVGYVVLAVPRHRRFLQGDAGGLAGHSRVRQARIQPGGDPVHDSRWRLRRSSSTSAASWPSVR
jgi:hypothetical protein